MSSIVKIIWLIACHGGPADHFATFAPALEERGYEVRICASGPALQKMQERNLQQVIAFNLEEFSAEETARKIAEKCSGADIVMTDVGHTFDVALQEALAKYASSSLRLAYYDNPESFVPGGYSLVAAKVMQAADRVLFANARLVNAEEIEVPIEKRRGIGYYPLDAAEKIRSRRCTEQKKVRARLFEQIKLNDRGQKVLVYAGGNNEEYFEKAFPAFLEILSSAENLSDVIVCLQQHPGAKKENRDVRLFQQWQRSLPPFYLSQLSSEDALIAADAIFYYQTSMGPQFVLAGIPTVQVGHVPYNDVLVKNGLCSVATNAKELMSALKTKRAAGGEKVICESLGIHSDWADRLAGSL